MSERCKAVVIGIGHTGRWYCGYPAKSTDINGRPVCGVHREGHPGIEWFEDRYDYPEGTGGNWEFVRGTPRGSETPAGDDET